MAFSQSAENVVLSLPDFTVLLNNAIAQLQPSVAGRLPTPLGTQLGEDIQTAMGESLLRGLQAARRVRGYVWLALLTGAICLAGSVGLSPNRRRALFLAGLAFAAAAVVLFALPGLLGALVTARIDDPALELAARGVWVAFTARLEVWALVLAGMGLVLAAAATSLASHLELEQALGRAWAWLRRPTSHPARDVARVAILLGAGASLICGPWTRPSAGHGRRRGARVRGLAEPLRPHRAAARRGRRACARGAGRNAAGGEGPPGASIRARRRARRGRPDRGHRLVHQWWRGAASGGVRRSLQRLEDAVRSAARHRHVRRRPQRNVGGRLSRLDVPQPGGGDGRAVTARHPRAALRRAQWRPGRRAREDGHRRRGQDARDARGGARGGGRGGGHADPRPPGGSPRGADAAVPVPRILRDWRAPARGRAAGRARLPRPAPGRGAGR